MLTHMFTCCRGEAQTWSVWGPDLLSARSVIDFHLGKLLNLMLDPLLSLKICNQHSFIWETLHFKILLVVFKTLKRSALYIMDCMAPYISNHSVLWASSLWPESTTKYTTRQPSAFIHLKHGINYQLMSDRQLKYINLEGSWRHFY